MKRIMAASLGILLFSSLAFTGEVTKVGTTAAGFLSIHVGSRAVSMGGAYVAVAEDATAMYWNPSGIARMEHFQFLSHHTQWFADIGLNYFGLVVPLEGIGSFGLNVTSLTMDDMEKTTVNNPEGTGEHYSAGSYAVGLCFARNLTDRFSIGFNAKYLNERIYNCSASGVAFDVGTLFTTQFSGLKIGMSISNYGPKMRMAGQDLLTQVDIDPLVSGNNENMNADLKTDGFDLPLLFRIGLAMDVLKGLYKSNLTLAIDALHPNNDEESVNVGAEYVFNKLFFIRGGYNSLFAKDSESGLTLGCGVRYNLPNTDLLVDYAYQDFGVLNNVQMLTVGIGF